MGLDQYLDARKYISQVDWKSVPQRSFDDDTPIDYSEYYTEEYKTVKQFFPDTLPKYAESGATVSMGIGYWRKANQIHGWFVREIQDGVDDCGSYHVPREKLVELLETIQKVLDGDKSVARELLPVTAGSFFGNYSEDDGYDQWYYKQLRYTEEMLEHILVEIEEGNYEYDIYYHSSW